MKQFIQTLSFVFVTSLVTYSQMPSVDSPQYQLQKQNGTLQGSVPAFGTIIEGDPMSPGGGPVVSPLAGCACYVEPDATWSTLNLCDDCSSPLITLPFNICFFGNTDNSLYINANGNISFNSPYGTFTPPPLPSAGQAIIGPFWGDVDMSSGSVGNIRYKITPTAIYVNWVNVGYYPANGSLRNTFSVIITNGSDPTIGVGNNVAFCYKDMQWTTGGASGGVNGFGGTPATVGANWGTAGQFIRIGTFNAPGTTYNGPNLVSQVSWLDYKSFKFNVCNNVNAPPVLISGNFLGYTFQPDTCNTINGGVMSPNPSGPGGICVGQTVTGALTFTGPENTQNVTITASGPPGLTAPTVTGNAPTLNISYTPTAGTSGLQTITVTATDNGNPAMSTTVTLQVNVTAPPYYPTISGPTNICPGGIANLAVNEVFNTYLWSGAGSGNLQTTSGSNGTYNVTVTFGACTLSTTKTVGLFVPPVPVIIGNSQVCAGQTTPISTTTPYVGYSWSNGDMTPIANAGLGVHTVLVTDTNGCTGTSQPFTITEFIPLPIQADPINVSCFGLADGQLTVNLAGATGTETITWAHDPTLTSFTATGLVAGTYTFTVIDANGCVVPGTGIVTEPTALQNTISTVNVTCPGGSDGSAIANPSGGTTPYYFLWNNDSTENQISSTGYSMGTYPLIVADDNGCYVQQSFTLTELSSTPTITSTTVIESCPGAANGSIDLNVAGGTPGFTYLWNNSDSNEDPQNLATGTYQVTVTDVNNCPYTYSTFVDVGENLTLNQTVTDVLCFGDLTGSIVITPVTGIAPFTVLMNGASASLNNANLGAGHYDFYLTDVNGCYFSFSSDILEPTLLEVDSTYTLLNLGDVTTLDIFASGGVAPYTYNWIPASFLSCSDCTSPLAYPVNTTSYTIEVTDANGCVSYGEAMVEINASSTFAPASFTPNGDGLNDMFLVSIVGVKEFEMRIYSRWGEKVFESNDIYKGWDGKVNGKLIEGNVYTYKIYVRLLNGKEREEHGTVTILR